MKIFVINWKKDMNKKKCIDFVYPNLFFWYHDKNVKQLWILFGVIFLDYVKVICVVSNAIVVGTSIKYLKVNRPKNFEVSDLGKNSIWISYFYIQRSNLNLKYLYRKISIFLIPRKHFKTCSRKRTIKAIRTQWFS